MERLYFKRGYKLRYVRLTNGLNDRGQLVPEDKVFDIIKTDSDWYQSVFYYNEKHFEQFKSVGTIKGIKDTTTNKLVFDIDSKSSVDDARKSAIEVLSRLKSQAGIEPTDVEIYSSANKGFHIILTGSKFLTPMETGNLATRIAGDIPGFDLTMYDANQLLRVPFTKHQKTGNHKIPLSFDELKGLSVDAIFNKSKNLDNVEMSLNIKEHSLPPEFYRTVERVEATVNNISMSAREVLARKPKQWKDSKWLIAEGFFESGERHHAMMVLAATYKGMGYNKENTYGLCKSAARQQAERTKTDAFPKEELWNNVMEAIFDDGWEGGQYSVDKDPWLKQYSIKMGVFESDSIEDIPRKMVDIDGEFSNFVLNIEDNTILTGIKWLDEEMPLTIGNNLAILGAPSSGKSALALEILKNTSQAGVITVFASLDMTPKRMYQKLLHKVSGLGRDELFQRYRDGRGNELRDLIAKDYGNVWFYSKSSPSVSDIREYIINLEKRTGQKVKMLMVDYFERINSDKSEETAASKQVAGQLQDILNDLDICIVTLVQPNKHAIPSPDTPLLSYSSIKGSSYLAQAFRSVVSIWRPFFNPETVKDDKFLEMAILKNDLGELGKHMFAWDGLTGSIVEPTTDEKTKYGFLMNEKSEKKAEKAGNDGWN